MSTEPQTPKPAEAEYANYSRWAAGPLATFRQFWMEREAQAICRQRTGRGDPLPALRDYDQASRVIPAHPLAELP